MLEHVWEAPSDATAPVLLTLHGTGGDERDLLPLARELAPGAGILSPRGPVVEADGVARFFRRIPTGDRDAYPFTFDDQEIAATARAVGDLLTSTLRREGLASRPCYATGFSNGANMAAALLLLVPGLLRGAVLFAPMAVLSDPPPTRLDGTPVWLGHGRADPIASAAQVERLAAQLSQRGAQVEVHVHDGGHEVPATALSAGAQWLGARLADSRGHG